MFTSHNFQHLILGGPFVKNRGSQKGLIVKKNPRYHTVLLATLQQFCNTVARYHCKVIKWGNTDIYSLSALIAVCISLESSIPKAAIGATTKAMLEFMQPNTKKQDLVDILKTSTFCASSSRKQFQKRRYRIKKQRCNMAASLSRKLIGKAGCRMFYSIIVISFIRFLAPANLSIMKSI